MTDTLLDKTLHLMDVSVADFTGMVPPPQAIPFHTSFVYRHVERLPQQAIVQKLARIPSGLRAARLLMTQGLFQEQSALQRIADELSDDVFFLSIPLLSGGLTTLHQEYLNAFFQEDFDAATGKPLAQDRPMIPRKKIRAYIANSEYGTEDPSGAIHAARTVHKTDSGFVHASSPHIMDTYGGNPPRFHVSGMLGTVREAQYSNTIYNYFYRSLAAFGVAAIVLGSNSHLHATRGVMDELDLAMAAAEQ